MRIDGCLSDLSQAACKIDARKKGTESSITEADRLSLPCQLIDHGRNVQSVAELKDFKANEFFKYLFNVGMIVLREHIPAAIYHRYLKPMFRVRLLLETSAEKDILVAIRHLDSFCREAIAIFGTEKSETIN